MIKYNETDSIADIVKSNWSYKEFENPRLISKLRRMLGIDSRSEILGFSEIAKKFEEEHPEIGQHAKTLHLCCWRLHTQINESPAKNFLNIQLENFAENFKQYLKSQIFIITPISLDRFFCVSWIEYFSKLNMLNSLSDTHQDIKILDNVLELGQCNLRATHGYLLMCETMLKFSRPDVPNKDLSLFLEAVNHGEIAIILNKAILDKSIAFFAKVAEVNIDGKGETEKKLKKIESILMAKKEFLNHWRTFRQLFSSDDYKHLNNYRTGLVHKFSPSETVAHKNYWSGYYDGLKKIEKIVKDSNRLAFYSVAICLFVLNEKTILKADKNRTAKKI